MAPLLEVHDLVTTFQTDQGVVHAVNGISYSLNAGEALAIVGESGSGKSVGALSIMGLIRPPGVVERGEAVLSNRDLLKLSSGEMSRVRGREMAMIFQDPMTSLNPLLSVGYQLTEALSLRLGMRKSEAKNRAGELLDLVGIPNASGRLREYPHQFSGGQRQRIMIAMALCCDPAVLIADEPTTALDVTVQAQIVDLIKRLQEKLGMALLWITHNLALVAGTVDKVAVMYAGYIVEQALVKDLYKRPAHPYTLGLLQSMPRPDARNQDRLVSIEGTPPDLREQFGCCPFAPRCPYVVEKCLAENPPLLTVDESHSSACWRGEEIRSESNPQAVA